MSVVIIGGNECMVGRYEKLCREYSCKAKVFAKSVTSAHPIFLCCLPEQCRIKCCTVPRNRQKNETYVWRTARPHLSRHSEASLIHISKGEPVMSEKLIIDHCSPTLAGIKTANLFNCPCENRKELNDTLRELNTRFVPKGLRIVPVKYMENRALIYIYRPEKLKSDLENAEADALLREKHYPTGNADKCVAELVRRFRSQGGFPHEIGLFLSYPPEDVLGFIHNKAGNHKCLGCWKVYGNEQEARSIFEKYNLCSKTYFQQWKEGKSIEQLTVAG